MIFFSLIFLLSQNYNDQIEGNKNDEALLVQKNEELHKITQDFEETLNSLSQLKEKALEKSKEVKEFNTMSETLKKSIEQNNPNKIIPQKIKLTLNKKLKEAAPRSEPINISLIKLSSETETLRSSFFNDITKILFPTKFIGGILPTQRHSPYKTWEINGTNVIASFRCAKKAKIRQIIVSPIEKRKCTPKTLTFRWLNNEFSSVDKIELPETSNKETIFYIEPKMFRDFEVLSSTTYGQTNQTCIPEFELFDTISF